MVKSGQRGAGAAEQFCVIVIGIGAVIFGQRIVQLFAELAEVVHRVTMGEGGVVVAGAHPQSWSQALRALPEAP